MSTVNTAFNIVMRECEELFTKLGEIDAYRLKTDMDRILKSNNNQDNKAHQLQVAYSWAVHNSQKYK